MRRRPRDPPRIKNQPATLSRGFAGPAKPPPPPSSPPPPTSQQTLHIDRNIELTRPQLLPQPSNLPQRLPRKNPPLPLLRRTPQPPIHQRHVPTSRSLQQLTPSRLNRPRNKPIRMRLPQRRYRGHSMQHIAHRADPHNQHTPRPLATHPILESIPQATIFSRGYRGRDVGHSQLLKIEGVRTVILSGASRSIIARCAVEGPAICL